MANFKFRTRLKAEYAQVEPDTTPGIDSTSTPTTQASDSSMPKKKAGKRKRANSIARIQQRLQAHGEGHKLLKSKTRRHLKFLLKVLSKREAAGLA